VPLLAELQPTTSVLTVSPTSTSYGSTVTLSAVVSPATPPGYGAPTGSVTFTQGGVTLGTAFILNGSAVLTLSSLAAGTDPLSCTYNGSYTYAVSQCNTVPVTITAAPSTLTLRSSQNPAPALTSVTFTAVLSVNGQAAPAGQAISLTLNGQTLALTTNANGTATYSTSTLAPGSYPVTASFAGSASVQGASAGLTQVITALPPAVVTLGASPGVVFLLNPVTLAVTVSSSYATPAGTVTFLDGGVALGTFALVSTGSGSSTASLTTAALALGTHSITASYSGDGNFPPAVSAAVAVVVEDFSLTVPNSPVTIAHGGTAVFDLAVGAVGGPGTAAAIGFTLSGNPDHSPVTFSPASIAAGSGSTTATLTIATPDYPVGPWSGVRPRTRGVAWAVIGLGAMLLPLGLRRRRGPGWLALVAAASMLLAGSTGCGSGWPAQSYRMTVTATAGKLSHSAVAVLVSEP
jgi:hypothetical protein